MSAAVAAGSLAFAGAVGAQAPPTDDLINPEWITNTVSRALTPDTVQNNLVEGAVERRDRAIAEWKQANQQQAKAKARAKKLRSKKARAAALRKAAKAGPAQFSMPEYLVVWSGKANLGDVSGKNIMTLLGNGTFNPEGWKEFANIQFLPGLDGFQVVDARKRNVDGSRNPDYGRVVNFVQLPLPWGVEAEPHHMQYEWHDGQMIVAGGLFNDSAFVLDPADIPSLTLKNTITPEQTPLGSVPDAFDAVTADGKTFSGTWMGGPDYNFAGSPGSIVTLKPDAAKGLVFASEVPSGEVGGIFSGNAGGVPEPCNLREARPLGTCANPHGIQARPDLGVMVTADYAEPREVVTDPVKAIDQYTFRPTVRSWDISDPMNPKLTSVSHMPANPRDLPNRGHQNIGIMEDAKTWGDAKGMFAGSMCGGGIFFTPDITKLHGDASKQWQMVWDDGLAEVQTDMRDAAGIDGSKVEEPGACAGGAWHQVSADNRFLFRAVQGRVPLSDNFYDLGNHKMVYDISIEKLIESAKDGKIDCDMSNGIDLNNDGKISWDDRETGRQLWNRMAEGEQIADCPSFADSIVVDDRTTGGPHWAAIDNHSTANGAPTRLVFSDYFVGRSGVDGNHRMYLVDVNPKTGKMSYDKQWRDEVTGALGVDFNRRNWPGSPDAGFYKPHSMIWVCPPGICN